MDARDSTGVGDDGENDVDIAVIGAGFGGLGAAIRLRQAGWRDFVVLEAANDIGGTWRDNSYPGCTCDVPSHLYSFSFAPNPMWSNTYSGQREIWDYLRSCVDRFGIGPHLRLATAVRELTWDDANGRWHIDTSAGAGRSEPERSMTEQRVAGINLDRRGTGEPLLLIHGIGHRWQAWEPVLETLAERHDVIAIDLPGFGKSPRPVGGMPPSVPALAATLGSFLAELGVDRPHVAGNSLGGGLALELAAVGLARSATALSPAGFATRTEAMRALAILLELRGTTYLPETAIRRIVASPAGRRMSVGMIVAKPADLSTERTVGDALAMRRGKGFVAMARALHGYAFQAVPAVPVTIAWGDHDRILIPRQAARAEQRLPVATHVGLGGCGHVPMSDDPELISATILATTGAVVSPA